MRKAILRLTPELFIDCLKRCDGQPRFWRVIDRALPDDAEFLRAGHDDHGDLLLLLKSNAFEDVPNGTRPPELPSPVCEIVRPDKEPSDAG